MMKKMLKGMALASIAVAVFAALLLTGCDSGGGGGGGYPNLKGTITIHVDGVARTTADTGMTLTAVYSGTEEVSYQWNLNKKAIDGAVDETYNPTKPGDYTVTAKAEKFSPKTSAKVIVSTALAGTLVIKNAAGEVVTQAVVDTELTAVYTGAGSDTVTYEWIHNDTNEVVSEVAKCKPEDLGTYTVTANVPGMGSKTATVEITLDPLEGTLVINNEDGVDMTTSGAAINTKLYAVYSGSEPGVTYQWFVGTDTTGTPASTDDNYTPTTLGIHTVTANATGYHGLSVTINIVQALLAGELIINRTAGGNVTGASVTINTPLTALYEGAETVTFEWFKDATSVATTAAFTPTETGTYTVTISADGYSSKSVSVSVNEVPDLEGTIDLYGRESDGTGIVNNELTAYYNGNEPGVTIRWYQEGNSTALTAPETGTGKYKPTAVGTYYAVASLANYNSVTSDLIVVNLPSLVGTLNVTPTSPTTFQPLTATWAGTPPTVNYEWRHIGVGVVGTNSGTYTPSEAGTYTVTISVTGYNPITSDPITVALSTLSGNVTITPAVAKPGDTLNVSYSGSDNQTAITFQWYHNNVALANEHGASLPVDEEGDYKVVASAQGYNSKDSNTAKVELADLTGTITITPTPVGHSNSYTLTGDTLTAVYSGSETGTKNWQWKKDGANIGSNSNTFSPTDAGSYTVTVSLFGYHGKESAAITVYQRVTVTFNPNGGNWGGSTANKTTITRSGQTIADPGDPTRDYFDFGGWYENAAGTGSQWNFASSTPSATMTLYAKWNARPLALSEVAGYLAAQTGGATADDPISLKVNGDLETTSYSSTFRQLMLTIGTADKYVNLDLSGSTMTGTAFGYQDYSDDQVSRQRIVGFVFPSSATITSIENYAFRECRNLTAITLPASLTTIGRYAFQSCRALTMIAIPAGVTSIGDNAFYQCTNLTAITIPSTVTNIGNRAFYQCINLTAITLPAGITTIGTYTFYECSSLTAIDIPSSVTFIEDRAFQACSGLTTVTIPEGVTAINPMTFVSCSNLTTVTIPSTVTSITDRAFGSCSKLATVIINATTPPEMPDDPFGSTPTTMQIKVPAGSVDAYKAAAGYWSTYASRVVSQ